MTTFPVQFSQASYLFIYLFTYYFEIMDSNVICLYICIYNNANICVYRK